MGNKLKEAKSLFVEACKISSKIRKTLDINFKFNLAIHIVYLRLKEQKFKKATFWLNFSKKLLQQANLHEEIAKYQWVHIFYYRGKISDFSGDYEQAKFYYNQAIDLAETIGWKRAINMVKNWLADIAVKQGNLKEAKPMLEECLRVAEENSDKCSIAFCKESMAFLENKNGNLQEAIRLANLAYENFISLGMLIEAEATRLFIETIK
jgi:LuxR family glucitol operon transcriptional activator